MKKEPWYWVNDNTRAFMARGYLVGDQTTEERVRYIGEFAEKTLGKKLVIDMEPQGDGKYEGQVWRPSNDKVYYGTIALNGNSMKLAGCVAGGLICSKQTWTRLK